MAAAMVGAFALWALGVLVERYRAALCERLGLRPLAYESPIFHSSIAAGLIVVAIRAWLSWDGGAGWTAHAWCPLALSLLALLMLRPYPRPEWVHLSLAFLRLDVVSAVSPSLTSPAAVALAGHGTGARALRARAGPPLPRARDLPPAGHRRCGLSRRRARSGPARSSAVAMTGAVADRLLGDGGGPSESVSRRSPAIAPADWWLLLAALVLAAGYLGIAIGRSRGLGLRRSRQGVLSSCTRSSCWDSGGCGVAGSPLARWLPPASDYYPIVTAIAALSAIHLGRRFTDPESWHELAWLGDVRSEAARGALAIQACVLAVLAIVFTGGVVSGTTVATMALAAIAPGARRVHGRVDGRGGSGEPRLGRRVVGPGHPARPRSSGLPAADQQATWAAWGAMIVGVLALAVGRPAPARRLGSPRAGSSADGRRGPRAVPPVRRCRGGRRVRGRSPGLGAGAGDGRLGTGRRSPG